MLLSGAILRRIVAWRRLWSLDRLRRNRREQQGIQKLLANEIFWKAERTCYLCRTLPGQVFLARPRAREQEFTGEDIRL